MKLEELFRQTYACNPPKLGNPLHHALPLSFPLKHYADDSKLESQNQRLPLQSHFLRRKGGTSCCSFDSEFSLVALDSCIARRAERGGEPSFFGLLVLDLFMGYVRVSCGVL